MPIPLLGKLIKGFVSAGGIADAADIEYDNTAAGGILNGVTEVQTSLARLDGTGIGAGIFRFTGNLSAQASNIDDWFGGRQLTRLRCIDNSGLSPVNFDLPGTTALNTAFDQLVTAGLPEVLRFVIEYTGASNAFLQIRPRISPAPQIQGATTIIVRDGVAATVEITRESSVISSYVNTAIGLIGDVAGGTLDALKLINPTTAIWDASANGPLPSNGVVKGNAYRVVNAPTDGSGRFGEVMQDGDWVVWEAETFTSWSAMPVQWFVLPAHDVRRISALESDFLNEVAISTPSDRNTVVRGALYSATAGEIRLKLYATQADYSAADLNTTGDIDEYIDPSTQTGFLGIRLSGTLATVAGDLPDLYVYAQHADGTFTRLLNLENDFTHQGDFGAESDFLSINTINYTGNDILRIYFGSVLDRYNAPGLDISRSNLTADLQALLPTTNGNTGTFAQRLATLESKMAALYPLTPDVTDLTEFSDIFDPERTASEVDIRTGYSLLADYRGSSTRYESAGVTYDDTGSNVVTYTGLGDNLYRTFGFRSNAIAQVSEITLTGTSGTANIDVDSTNYLATFDTDLTTTAANFVTTHATALNTAGVTVTSNAAVLTFTANVGGTAFTIAAPANVSGNLGGTLDNTVTGQTLLWIVNGSERIPFVDTTTSGNYRLNNYIAATTQDRAVENESHYITTISGQQTLRPGTNDTATFTVTPYPASSTQQTRSAQIGLDVLVNGADTQGEHLQFIELPAANTAQDATPFDASIPLGPLYNNRTVNVRMSYAVRISGDDALIDVRLITAPSDVTIRIKDVFVFLSYTAQVAVPRVDNFVILNDGSGDYSYTGTSELLITFHPIANTDIMEVVPVAILESTSQVTQLNDVNVPQPTHFFESVEIPDTTAFPNFQFRTFSPEHFLIHRDLVALMDRRATQWVYGLALLRAITENAITAQVDFTQGLVLTDTSTSDRYLLSVDNGQFKHEILP